MNEEQLIAFERIVREGSFSRAAWALGIAQPTISARVAALEEAVGGPLFVRGRRPLTLTERGTAFLPYARKALAALGEGVEAARLAQRGERGRVTLGVLGSLTGSFLAPVLTNFHQRYPDVACYIEDGNHQQIIEWLIDGVVEIGLIAWPRTDAFAVELTPLLHCSEEVVLLTAPHHPLAQQHKRQQPVTQEDVATLSDPFLLMRWWQITPDPLARLAARARTVYDLPMPTGAQLVLNGMGAGFFTRAQIGAAAIGATVVEIPVVDLQPLYRTSALVHLAGQSDPLSAPTQNLVAAIRAQASRLRLLSDQPISASR
jgi:DNA-binding transcriptional LysR family regulator